jgi:hopanoid C-3 methylase
VAINIIADPEWDRERFRVVREWCMEIPEVVNISVNTPYPGTETWYTESRKLATRDYRLFDIQHAVLPTHLPLPDFYTELVQTQQVLNRKHLGARQLLGAGKTVTRLLAHGQTNFLRMLFKFNSVYDPKLQLADHERPVKYEIALPPEPRTRVDPAALYVHQSQGRRGREIDNATEQFVDNTRMGVAE